jgi:hypothetical protein
MVKYTESLADACVSNSRLYRSNCWLLCRASTSRLEESEVEHYSDKELPRTYCPRQDLLYQPRFHLLSGHRLKSFYHYDA